MKQFFGNVTSRMAACVGVLIIVSTPASAYEFRDLGTIVLTSHWRCPPLTMEADGQVLQINSNVGLFSALGTTFGGDGRTTFGLPDLRDAAPRSSNGQQLHYCIISSMSEEADSADEASGGATNDRSDVFRDHRVESHGGGRENEVVPARRGRSRSEVEGDK